MGSPWKIGPMPLTSVSVHVQTALGYELLAPAPEEMEEPTIHLVDDDQRLAVCSVKLDHLTQFLGVLGKVNCPDCQAWIAAKYLIEEDIWPADQT